MFGQRRNHGRAVAGIALIGAAALLAACSSSGGNNNTGGNGGKPSGAVPTANLPVLKKIGKGEGRLNLIAWLGYLQPQ